MKSVALALGLLALSPPARENAPSHIDAAARPVGAIAGHTRRHEFTATVFRRQFSAQTPPVLTISPGDTIHTTTIDAGGVDEKDQQRSPPGNPQTGPFYVAGARPGDTLVGLRRACQHQTQARCDHRRAHLH